MDVKGEPNTPTTGALFGISQFALVVVRSCPFSPVAAHGTLLSCNSGFLECSWWIGGYVSQSLSTHAVSTHKVRFSFLHLACPLIPPVSPLFSPVSRAVGELFFFGVETTDPCKYQFCYVFSWCATPCHISYPSVSTAECVANATPAFQSETKLTLMHQNFHISQNYHLSANVNGGEMRGNHSETRKQRGRFTANSKKKGNGGTRKGSSSLSKPSPLSSAFFVFRWICAFSLPYLSLLQPEMPHHIFPVPNGVCV